MGSEKTIQLFGNVVRSGRGAVPLKYATMSWGAFTRKEKRLVNQDRKARQKANRK
jgi:hypothetical protein